MQQSLRVYAACGPWSASRTPVARDRDHLTVRRVGGVDLGCLDVRVAKPRLNRAERHRAHRHLRTKQVPEGVERHAVRPPSPIAKPSSFERDAESVDYAPRRQMAPGVRIREHQVVGTGSTLLRAKSGEHVSDLVDHRHGSDRAEGLRVREATGREGLFDADQGRVEVDVLPPERQQLASTQTGPGGDEVENTLNLSEGIVGDGAIITPKLVEAARPIRCGISSKSEPRLTMSGHA